MLDFILHLPDGQVELLGDLFFEEISLLIHHTCKNFFWLVKTSSRLVHPGKIEFLFIFYSSLGKEYCLLYRGLLLYRVSTVPSVAIKGGGDEEKGKT